MSTMLLDSASQYFRAFYGVPDTMRAPDGTSTNAVRGFLDMIARLVTAYRPTGMVACLDEDWRPAFRVDAIPSYKAHRVDAADADAEEVPDQLSPQVPIILAALDALGIARVGAPGFEADDVIGTLARTIPGPIDVITGDRDLFQTIDDDKGVRVFYTGRGMAKLEIFDNALLHSKYAVEGHQYADFAALRGDASDGLPGVAGIGEKGAATLIRAYGDLDGIRLAAADIRDHGPMTKRQRTSLMTQTEYLDAAPIVVRVRLDVPLPAIDHVLPPTAVDPAAVIELADRWGIGSSLTRVEKALRAL